MNYVLLNCKYYDSSGASIHSGKSILVSGNTIKHIGQFSECISLADTTPELLDLKGKIVLPAFTDTHTHFVELAKRRIMVDLSNCQSLDEIRTELTGFREIINTAWVLGGGWDKNILDHPEMLNNAFLDSIFPDLPVALWSKDYHAKLCNSLALRIAGITESSPDPSGGKLGRDASGKLNGILYEKASDNLEPFIVQPDRDILLRAIRETVNEAHSLGITGIHTMEGAFSWGLLEEDSQRYQDMRYTWHFPPEELVALAAKGLMTHSGDHWLRIGGMKLFADGALGSQTAAIFTPYTNTRQTGILRYSDEELLSEAQQAVSQGFALSIHAIGTRAVHQVLSIYKQINTLYPNPGHRLEHVQSIRPEELPLLKESGAFCAMQPVHLANDVPMIEKHWQEIKTQAYCFKDIIANCTAYGFGSDAPIETINPFLGIYTAVQRKHALNPASESWQAGQAISQHQAIYGYTMGAAKLNKTDDVLGTIKPGYLADLIVMDDFEHLGCDYWLEARPSLVMCNGRIVFET